MDLNNSGGGWGGFPVPAGALPLADSIGAAGFGSGFDAFGTGGVPDVVLPQVAPHMGLHPQHAQHAQHPQQHDANAWMWQQQQAQQQHAQLAVGAIGVPVLHAQPATQPSFGLGGAGFGNQLLSQISLGLNSLPHLDSTLVNDLLTELEPLLAQAQQAQQAAQQQQAQQQRARQQPPRRALTQQRSEVSQLLMQLLEGGGPGGAGGGGGLQVAGPSILGGGSVAVSGGGGGGGGGGLLSAGPSFLGEGGADWLNQLDGVLSLLPTTSLPTWSPDLDLDLPGLEGLEGEGAGLGRRLTRSMSRQAAEQRQQPGAGPGTAPAAAAGAGAGRGQEQARRQSSDILRRLIRLVSTNRTTSSDLMRAPTFNDESLGPSASGLGGLGSLRFGSSLQARVGAGGRALPPGPPKLLPRQLRAQQLAAQRETEARLRQQQQQQCPPVAEGSREGEGGSEGSKPQRAEQAEQAQQEAGGEKPRQPARSKGYLRSQSHKGESGAAAEPAREPQQQQQQQQLGRKRRSLDRQESAVQPPPQRQRAGPDAAPAPAGGRLLRSSSSTKR